MKNKFFVALATAAAAFMMATQSTSVNADSQRPDIKHLLTESSIFSKLSNLTEGTEYHDYYAEQAAEYGRKIIEAYNNGYDFYEEAINFKDPVVTKTDKGYFLINY
ncbi:hypothetical protein ACVRY7_05070 [Streptococcus ictaluri]|uniref:Uncharacterized protein n=2 Tax=Streptococcus ictaluri TaxID=380397 RepID=G5JZD2_9STRE|nr:hypothetical protein STRIC_0642 [Streptococcus ictaluri 707-05]